MSTRALLALLATLSLAACDAGPAPEAAIAREAAFARADTTTIPAGPDGDAVRRGRAILEATGDSMPQHVGNDLRCMSCHLDGGMRPGVLPFVGVYARFPQYRARSGAVIDLEERIGDCFVRSLNGSSPAYDSREMRDMIAYMAWVSRGVPVGATTPGQGLPALAPLDADTVRGREVFRAECSRCHGEDGQGLVPPAPPLWGERSYNIGAGMARLRTAAAFIRVAMPFDRPGTLTAQQAYDVAAYMNGRPRPDLAGKENDWPNGDPPPDVAYPTTAKRAAQSP